ncbi:MAG: GNAT family N-acetyltransferase [Chthoniobacterales bacterium]
MPDLLVKLYDLPSALETPVAEVVETRRAFSAERQFICDWLACEFSHAWAAEAGGCFGGGRVSCFVATCEGKLVGVACYDTTARGMFGPIGIAESSRHRGLGRQLLLTTLRDMASAGYAYAVIGGAGADVIEFYRKAVGAIPIADSEPGFYRGMLKLE